MASPTSSPRTSILVLGARGSIPVSGPQFMRYGGSTTCLALLENGRIVAFIDAGTGLMAFRQRDLRLIGSIPMFLTHYHWDHIQGISMLGEVWSGACLFTIYGPQDPEPMLTEAIKPPWFPVSLDDAPEPVKFRSMDGEVQVGSFTISSFDVQHPQGAIGYRIKGANRTLAIVTDHESAPDCDDIVAAATDGADILMHDSQYLPAEVPTHIGWGHSTWEDAVVMARRIGATELILTSHEPSRTDDEIDAMVEDAREEFASVVAAGPDMEIQL